MTRRDLRTGRLCATWMVFGLLGAGCTGRDTADSWAAVLGSAAASTVAGQLVSGSAAPSAAPSIAPTSISGSASVSTSAAPSSSVSGASSGALSVTEQSAAAPASGTAPLNPSTAGASASSPNLQPTGSVALSSMPASSASTSSVSTSTAAASSSAVEVDVTQPHTIWLAGDSTVANGNTPCPTGWGKHFNELFTDSITVVNSAAGGASVRTWMYLVQTTMGTDDECLLTLGDDGEPKLQGRWQAMLDGMTAGDVLMIQFGINDGSSTCDRHVGLDAFKESYGVLAEAATARGAQPVFVTPVSAIACDGNSRPKGTRGDYVDVTIEAGEEFDVPVIDLHQRSIERYTELGFCPIPGGDVNESTGGDVGEYFCEDHTHFSESGAPDIAALVAQGLRDLGLPITQYLR